MVDPAGDRRGETERSEHSPRPPRLVLPEEAGSRSMSPKDDDGSMSQHPSGGLSPAAPAGSTMSTASGSPLPLHSPDTERHHLRPWELDSNPSRIKEEEEQHHLHRQQRQPPYSDQPGGILDRADRSFSPGVSAGSGPSPLPQLSAYPPLKTNGLNAPASGSGMVKSPSSKFTSTTSAAKSRKSSCELCHHRKIKCDQGRPSCGSCRRKGHVCRYGDEAIENHSNAQLAAPRPVSRHPSSSGAVSPSNLDKLLSPAIPQQAAGGSQVRTNPEWSTSDRPRHSRADSSSSRANGSLAGGIHKSQRQRIVDGFDSESEDEAGSPRGSQAGGPGGVVGGSRGGSARGDGRAARAIDEVDELASGDESAGPRSRSGSSSQPPKRPSPADDGFNGELLELASGPPKKKARPTSMIATTSAAHPGGAGGRHSKTSSRPRASLPTYSSSTSVPHGQSARFDRYSTPLQAMAANLPSDDTQSILFGTFFADPFLTEGISLLQPQFLEDFRRMQGRISAKLREGDATTLTCAFAFLAVALRILPEETSRLLLAQAASPPNHPSQGHTWSAARSLGRLLAPSHPSVSDPTPLDQRYFDSAVLSMQVADQNDMPSVMLVMAKLTLTRFVLMRPSTQSAQSGPMALAGGWLAHAIKMAHTLGMGKEWEGIPQGERELRRRVMWSLYIIDRHWSFVTTNPYTILDAHQGIHLPSPISEADLYKLPGDATTLPAQSTESAPTPCTALFIHTHLARRVTPILDSFATVSPNNTPHELVVRFDASLDTFEGMLPPYFRLFPRTNTHWDSSHPYVPAHRVRLHAALLAYRLGVHRAHLPSYLLPATPPSVRAGLAGVCVAALRVQRSARMLDPKVSSRVFDPTTVFEAAATLGLLLHVEKMLGDSSPAEMMAWRGGVAEAGELLDGVGGHGDLPRFARRAVVVLREMMVRVDTPLPGDESEVANANGDLGPRSLGISVDDRAAAITDWMEKLLAEGMQMDALLREPEWEKGWRVVVAGM